MGNRAVLCGWTAFAQVATRFHVWLATSTDKLMPGLVSKGGVSNEQRAPVVGLLLCNAWLDTDDIHMYFLKQFACQAVENLVVARWKVHRVPGLHLLVTLLFSNVRTLGWANANPQWIVAFVCLRKRQNGLDELKL
jgi:hypothetical protein